MRQLLTLVLVLILGSSVVIGAQSHEYISGDLHIVHPWIRIIGDNRAELYVTIANDGIQNERLLSAHSPLADTVKICDENGVALQEIDIPGKDVVFLDSGGFRIELTNLNDNVTEGNYVPVLLIFEKLGDVLIDAFVEKESV